MPYDGSGNFTIINSFEEDRINGVSIDSLKMDNNFEDIANGLTDAMLRSGASNMTGALNMASHKILNVADGSASTDAINKGQMDTALSGKQNTLVSGTNIKTINSTSLIGSGNVAVQATITGAATTITDSNLTASRALVANSSGKVAVSSTTDTELGYVHGVTSAIQTQINGTVKTTGNQSIAGTKTFSAVAYGKASDAANSLLTTVASLFETSGTNKRYLKLGNGWIVQVGEFTYDSGNDEVEVTLPYTMSSTKYYVGVTFLTTARNSPGCITGRFTNKFKYKSSTFQSSGTALFIVVGK